MAEEHPESFGAKLRTADNFRCPLRSRGGPVLLEGAASDTKHRGAGSEGGLSSQLSEGTVCVHWLPIQPGQPWKRGWAESRARSSITHKGWGAGPVQAQCERQLQGLRLGLRTWAPAGLWGCVGMKPKCPGLCMLMGHPRLLSSCLTASPPTPALLSQVPSAWRQDWPTISISTCYTELNSPFQMALSSSISLVRGSSNWAFG